MPCKECLYFRLDFFAQDELKIQLSANRLLHGNKTLVFNLVLDGLAEIVQAYDRPDKEGTTFFTQESTGCLLDWSVIKRVIQQEIDEQQYIIAFILCPGPATVFPILPAFFTYC